MVFRRRKKPADDPLRAESAPPPETDTCPGCRQEIPQRDFEANLRVCPRCGRHLRLRAHERIAFTADPGSFQETHADLRSADPLNFAVGKETYAERLVRAREQSGLEEALVTGFATIHGARVALGVMDSHFIMASMGSALGEKLCRLVQDAITHRLPLVIFAASGGARMQEGILALMQVAKTADAIRQVNEAGLPYVSILTDPTSGGVFASFASLGDLVIAEPKAYIGFAGTRLIEGSLKVKLPEGFQRAEYQFENGFLDKIVPRNEMRDFLGRVLAYLNPANSLHAARTEAEGA